MKDIGVKSKIYKEIMNLMDEKEGERLMSHPKVMAMKITTAKPLLGSKEDKKEDLLESESSDMENMEDKIGSDIDEISPEMIAKIIKALK